MKTQGKFIRISPTKARSVASKIRGMKALDAQITLQFMPQKSAKIIGKVLKTAISDAENNFLLDKKDLVVKAITVDKGPSFRRYQPAPKGMAHPIEKKTSHITIIVSGEAKIQRAKAEKPEKEVKKEEVEEVKIEKQEQFKPEMVKEQGKKQEEARGFSRFFRRKTG
ncbi:MAG: 50S ribosomal protein L22 [Patescibacteria group bacterium]|nr:50S ribosomal protein L22 [Patescibacteria group bacterium]